MLGAPAVADATGFAVAPSEPNAEIEGEDDTFSLKSRDLWKQQIENIHLTSSRKHDLPGSFGDLSRPVSLFY